MGTMDRAPSWTNTILIQDSLLYKYVNALPVYRCPADHATTRDPYGSGGGIPKVRSMSMNCWMNPINVRAADSRAANNPIRNFRKISDISKPSDTWVTIDENPRSINDGWFVCEGAPNSQWVDGPAAYHNNAGGLSFADGHSEIKKWRDPPLLNKALRSRTLLGTVAATTPGFASGAPISFGWLSFGPLRRAGPTWAFLSRSCGS
jgi:prepilin-type processing-associated H-X9-DG protein